MQKIHAVSDCKECGRNWCDANVWMLNEPKVTDYYIVAEPLKKLGCDKLPSGTYAVRSRDSGAIYAFDKYWRRDRIGEAPYNEGDTYTQPPTPYDDAWNRHCKEEEVIVGVDSFHSQWHDDRSWTISCGKLDTNKFYLGECTDSGYVNDYSLGTNRVD